MIIIHGLYGASDNWVSVARELANDFEVWLIDQRNHGRSPHHPEHSYEAMRNDLLEFMDTHQIGKAILVGHSMGGKTAMFFAAAYPERVQALVVVDIAPKSYGLNAVQEQRSISHQSIIEAMLAVQLDGINDRAEVEAQLTRSIPVQRTRQFLLKNLHRNADNSFSWSLNLNALRQNLHHILEGLSPADFDGGRGVTGFPTLFIRGEQSAYIGNDDVALIERLFPYAELVSIPRAGHWVHAEQPELLIKNIRYFVLE